MCCALGQNWDGAGCTGNAQITTWAGALQAAESAGFAGHSDWRLPDIKELGSIVDLACYDPAINATVFPNTPSNWFWSASPYAGSVSSAWYVHFFNGHDGFGSLTGYPRVRLVRGGQ